MEKKFELAKGYLFSQVGKFELAMVYVYSQVGMFVLQKLEMFVLVLGDSGGKGYSKYHFLPSNAKDDHE